MRANHHLGGSFATTGERHYYFYMPREEVKLTGKGKIMKTDLPEDMLSPEVFIRYNSKNRFFLQAGVTRTAYHLLYELDKAVEDRFNPNGYSSDGVIPKYHMDTYNATMTPYISAGYILLLGTVIKPYVTIGVSPAFLTRYEYAGDEVQRIIMQELDKRSLVTLNGRVSAGFQFYDLHVEVHASSNIGKMDATDKPFYDRVTNIYLAIGYNLFSFNLVKKKK
jgi:hypothetical protein